MTKYKPPKSPETNSLVKTVAGVLGVNVKRSKSQNDRDVLRFQINIWTF